MVSGDANSILHPQWDNLSMFETQVPVAKSVNIQRARETKIASMRTMGLHATWRRVYPEGESSVEVGMTRGDRHIDCVLLPPCVAEHVQLAFTTPIRQAVHQAVLMRLPPTSDRKRSNLWKFSVYLLGNDSFQASVQAILRDSRHMQRVAWWVGKGFLHGTGSGETHG